MRRPLISVQLNGNEIATLLDPALYPIHTKALKKKLSKAWKEYIAGPSRIPKGPIEN